MHPSISDCGMSAYRNIEHIDAIRQYSENDDRETMFGIGHIVCDAGMNTKVGAALLHRHHFLTRREFWYEQAEGDLVISRPTLHGSLLGPVHPMIYRITTKGPIPIHWRAGHDPHADEVSAFLESATPRLLDALGDDVNRFGIVRAPQYQEFKLGQMMFEESFVDTRDLINSWVKEVPPSGSVVETTWYFKRRMASQLCVEQTFCSPSTVCVPGGGNGKEHASRPGPHNRTSLGHYKE